MIVSINQLFSSLQSEKANNNSLYDGMKSKKENEVTPKNASWKL